MRNMPKEPAKESTPAMKPDELIMWRKWAVKTAIDHYRGRAEEVMIADIVDGADELLEFVLGSETYDRRDGDTAEAPTETEGEVELTEAQRATSEAFGAHLKRSFEEAAALIEDRGQRYEVRYSKHSDFCDPGPLGQQGTAWGWADSMEDARLVVEACRVHKGPCGICIVDRQYVAPKEAATEPDEAKRTLYGFGLAADRGPEGEPEPPQEHPGINSSEPWPENAP